MPIKNFIDGSSVASFYAYYDKNESNFHQAKSPKLGGNLYIETKEGEVVYVNSEGRIRTATIAQAYDDIQKKILQSSHELLNKLNNPSLRERTITSHNPISRHNSIAGTDPYHESTHKPKVLTKQLSEPALPTHSSNDFTPEIKEEPATSSQANTNLHQPLGSDDSDHPSSLAFTNSPETVTTSNAQSLTSTLPLASLPASAPVTSSPESSDSGVPPQRTTNSQQTLVIPTNDDSTPSKALATKSVPATKSPAAKPVTTVTVSAEELRKEREIITETTITFPDSSSKSEDIQNAEREFQRQVNILMDEGRCKTPEEEAARRPLIYAALVASDGADWHKDDYKKLDFDRLTVDITKLSASGQSPNNKEIDRHFRSARRMLAAHEASPQEPEDRNTVRTRRLNEERKVIKAFCKKQNLKAANLAEMLNNAYSKDRIDDLLVKSNSITNSGFKPQNPKEHSQKLDEDMMLIQKLSDQLKSKYPTYKSRYENIDYVPRVSAPSNKIWDVLKQMTVEGTEGFRFTEQEADDYRSYVLSLVPQHPESTTPINEQNQEELLEVVKFDDHKERLIRQQQMNERMRKRAEEREQQKAKRRKK